MEKSEQINLKSNSKKAEASRLEKLKKTVIIVGASSGIGFETALRMLGRGFLVANISRTPCALGRVKNYTADIASGKSLEKAIMEIAGQTENLYGLIYCAGFSMAAPIEYAEEQDYRYLFEINYFGALRAMKTVIPFLKKRGGRILLVLWAELSRSLLTAFTAAQKRLSTCWPRVLPLNSDHIISV